MTTTLSDVLDTTASAADWFLGVPLRIALTLIVGLVLLAVVRRIIAHLVARVARGDASTPALHADAAEDVTAQHVAAEVARGRRARRAQTIGSVLRSLAGGVIGTVVVTMVLEDLGAPVGPLLASLGIVGVALGFGAQALVKDVISGVFLLAEDQFGIGDRVDLGAASGVVEAVGLRTTQVRAEDGSLWYVRNGEITRVGNRSQLAPRR